MKHGTHAGYSRGCRCAACTDGHRVYQANFDRQRLYGTWVPYADDPLEDEETMVELLERIAALRSAGVGRRTICKATGVGSGTLWKITSGETKRVHRSTAAALFALTTNVLAPSAVIDGTETHRLIAELVAAGMQKRRIARCLGWGDSIQLKARVEAKNARLVKDFHDDLWPMWPALREACTCYAHIQFEGRREADRRAKRRSRAA